MHKYLKHQFNVNGRLICGGKTGPQSIITITVTWLLTPHYDNILISFITAGRGCASWSPKTCSSKNDQKLVTFLAYWTLKIQCAANMQTTAWLISCGTSSGTPSTCSCNSCSSDHRGTAELYCITGCNGTFYTVQLTYQHKPNFTMRASHFTISVSLSVRILWITL